ncbi:hypothetical protein [Natrinema versiforme]|nr:hypothetical protein [Natrinema versiforme]
MDTESVQEWIREQIRQEVGPDLDDNPDTSYYPERNRDRRVYEALLQHGGHDVLANYVRLDDIKPEMAMESQISKDDIYGTLKRMERHNHVRLESGMYANDPVQVRARPPSADPDMWTRAKSRDRQMDPDILTTAAGESSAAQRKLLRDIEAADDENTSPTEAVADD